MPDRRSFIRSWLAPGLGFAFWSEGTLAVLADLAAHPLTAEEFARDEYAWAAVQRAFLVDRSLINLNNGGVCPSPALVHDALKRYLDEAQRAPAYVLWQLQEPQKEAVRTGLARLLGTDREEIAITRNASESLQILQLGLELRRGDHVLTTTQDYPRMITTFKQRERREGLVLDQISLPVPCEEPQQIVQRFAAGITPRTRLILMSHVINLTGQIMPVRDVVTMARARGIPVLVDGAHALAQFPFTRDELDCDFYAVSLHKWLGAPHGTGLLYVRRDKIGSIWPLMAAPVELDNDIRKFEEIGTHPAANFLAIAEALVFHEGLGAARKAARLRYLRNAWAEPLLRHDRVKLHTSLDPRYSCAIGNVQIDGIDCGRLTGYLADRHRIFVTPIKHPEFEGIRVTPNVYTTLGELERFVAAMEFVIKNGLPAT